MKSGGKEGGAVVGATGVILLDALDVALTPYPLIVVTVNVYAVPLVKPVTVIGELEPLPVIELGEEVAT